MFAYCLNNPVKLSDPRGTIPFYDDPLQKVIEVFFEWFWETDENEKDENGQYTLSAKTKKTINSFVRNLEFSAGLGVGVGQEFNIMDVGVSLRANYDILAAQYCDGTWSCGQRITMAASSSLTQAYEFGGGIDAFRDTSGKVDPIGWILYNNTKESWTLFSFADYSWFLGGNVEVGFDLNTFLFEITALWEE